MGTSTSHPSPNNSNWKPVFLGYRDKKIPLERVINEIWRASENQDRPISKEISSEIVFKCHEVVKNSSNTMQALDTFNKEIMKSKANSMVVEFAKRVIPNAFRVESPIEEWRASFFAEITGYMVSRDISGYVGERYRNKSVNQLVEFKNSIANNVKELVRAIRIEPKSTEDWRGFVANAINRLRGGVGGV